jgi:regulator of sigma E protease
MTWLVVLVGLLFLVLIHEAGHFYTALAVGIRPRKFYIGFPPAIAKFKRNGVEYALGAIPLGGYVRIPGMHRPAPGDARTHFSLAVNEEPALAPIVDELSRRLEAEDEPGARAVLAELKRAIAESSLSRVAEKSANRGLRELDEALGEDAYWRQRTWKKIAVIFAGPGVNILFAVVLLAIVYAIGAPAPERAPARVAAVQKPSPAFDAGLRPGDVIVAINGRPTRSFDAVRNTVTDSEGQPLALTVRRHGTPMRLHAEAPRLIDGGWKLGFIWQQPDKVPLVSYPIGTSFRKAVADCWAAITGTADAIAGLFQTKERGQLTSVVGIARAGHRALEVSFRLYLQLLAFISLGLAILNLLPLLPLDGGHILFSAIEGIRRRAVAREVYERASIIGFALIMLLFFIALNNDLGRNGPG